MKNIKFAVVSLILSIVLFVPASLIFIASIFQLAESHPLSIVAFPFVILSILPEIPLINISQSLGFPIVLPTLSVLFALISLYKKENKRSMAITSIILVLVSIAMYLLVRTIIK